MSSYMDSLNARINKMSEFVSEIFEMHKGEASTVSNVSVPAWYKDVARELSAESSGLFADKAVTEELLQVKRDTSLLAPFFEKYGETHKDSLMKSIALGKADDALTMDATALAKALGYGDLDRPVLAEAIGNIYDMYSDPYSSLIKLGDRANRYGFSKLGFRLEEEAGLVSGIRGRSIFAQSDHGADFVPITGSFTEEQMLKQIEFTERQRAAGKTNLRKQGLGWWNVNDLNAEELSGEFSRIGLKEVGARVDQPGLAALDISMTTFESPGGVNRLYTEFTTVLSEKQRLAATSRITMAAKRTMIDTENQWGRDLSEGIWKNVAEFIGSDATYSKEMIAKELLTMDQGERVQAIEKLVQSNESVVFRSAYARKEDLTDVLTGGSGVAKRGDALEFRRGDTAEETIGGLYDFFTGLRRLHDEDKFILSGYNIRQHDLPGMGYMASLLGEYYERGGKMEEAEAMYSWGGKIDINTGQLISKGTFLEEVIEGNAKAVDLTAYQRLMPILEQDGSFYLGTISDAEQKLIDEQLLSGKTTKEASSEVARRRIQKQVDLELSGDADKLIKGLTSVDESARIIEETLNGSSSVGNLRFFEKLGISDELYEFRVSNFYQKYNSGEITSRQVQEAFKAGRLESLTEVFFGNAEAQFVASADRMKITEQVTIETGFDKFGGSMTREQWEAMRRVSHEAAPDVDLMSVADRILIEHIRNNGRIVQNYINMTPGEQWYLDHLMNYFKEDVSHGTVKYRNAVLDFKGKFLEEGADPAAIDYLLKVKNRHTIGVGHDAVQDFIDEITSVREAEGANVADRAVRQAEVLARHAAKAYDKAHVDMFEKLAGEVGMSIPDATRAVENFKFGQKATAIAGLSIVALSLVTNRIKERSNSYDSWKMGETMTKEEYEQERRQAKYNQEMAGMGDMTLESSNRRNYSYNMRGDRHDHLFKE